MKLSGLDQLTVMRPVNGRFAGNGKDWTLRPIGVTDHATLGPAGSSCNLSGSGYTTALIDRRSTQNEQWAIPATISAMYRECSGGRRNSSCTHACVQMGVNYSATYGTAPAILYTRSTPMQSQPADGPRTRLHCMPRCADTRRRRPTARALRRRCGRLNE